MKKIVLVVSFLVSCAAFVSAGTNQATQTQWHILLDSQTVSATAVVTSSAVYVADFESFSYMVVVSSGTSPEVDITYEIINSNAKVYTQVESTTTLRGIQPVWVQPATDGTIASSVSVSTADAFAPAATRYIRVKATGTAGNGADTVISVFICGYASR